MLKNIGFYFLLLLALSIWGFWESYFSKPLQASHLYTHLHTLSMLLWMLMLITQASLIHYQKYAAHKVTGRMSYILVPIICISLVLLAHSKLDPGVEGLSGSRLYLLFLQLSLLAIFLISYVLAIVYRHTPAIHARFMICTALTIIDPVFARLPLDLPAIPFSYQLYTFGLVDLILIIFIVLERKQVQGRQVFPFMLVVFVFFQWLNLNCTNSESWGTFAHWFAALPLS